MENNIDNANNTIKILLDKNKQQELQKVKKEKLDVEMKIAQLEGEILNFKTESFDIKNIIRNPSQFQYLCGLSSDQFNLVYECLQPYTHLIPYPDCISNNNKRSVDTKTELFSVLTICRHGLHQGVMAFMLKKSKSTMQRIFIGWVMFISTIFNQLDLKPTQGFLLKKMPKSFIETGHGLTDLVIDATEFKFQSASSFELNSLMFSNYKNTTTGKALIGISPHGMGLLFSDIYPGSISDSEITIKSGALHLVEPEHEYYE